MLFPIYTAMDKQEVTSLSMNAAEFITMKYSKMNIRLPQEQNMTAVITSLKFCKINYQNTLKTFSLRGNTKWQPARRLKA